MYIVDVIMYIYIYITCSLYAMHVHYSNVCDAFQNPNALRWKTEVKPKVLFLITSWHYNFFPLEWYWFVLYYFSVMTKWNLVYRLAQETWNLENDGTVTRSIDPFARHSTQEPATWNPGGIAKASVPWSFYQQMFGVSLEYGYRHTKKQYSEFSR